MVKPVIQVEQLPLWDVLKNATDAQRAQVKSLIEDAAAVLDRVIETFPTYTLHNSTHAVNVVRLMADLLGPARSKLRPLEAALLLLSAFYHDIGMVFDEAARNQLTEEPAWKSFLEAKPDAYLAVRAAGSVPNDIAEWYCRWRHAARVHTYLHNINDDRLQWGLISFREELGRLCESHSWEGSELYELSTDYPGEADLRFCAILLRLADILDFDHTRTPEAVYEYLGLSRRNEPRKSESDVEWRKHLCSMGFQFPKDRVNGYALRFNAGPKEPGVEHDVREFLDIIDAEFKKCKAIQASCSERWQRVHLPGSVDRSGIISNGYRYAEYRFTLDHAQVMDLLMGENLYRDPYVFVRELIQNALDTSRYRYFISGIEPKAVQVRDWTDSEGYHWVRFDDYGMGMNEETIRKHLLKVGASYYRTANFRAEVLRAQKEGAKKFVPISRFGIGILSCFIIGDRIEISTCGIGAEPIRLSLNGLHGFFTLQTPNLPAQPMPAPTPTGQEPGYRYDPGTSIAVRLDPSKERHAFDLELHLNRYVSCSLVPIEFEGARIGFNPKRFVDRPWCERFSYEFSPDDMASMEAALETELREPLRIEFVPVDLTNHSPTDDLKGQMVIAVLKKTTEWQQREINGPYDLQTSLRYAPEYGALAFRTGVHGRSLREIKVNLPNPETHKVVKALELREVSWLSHNGVTVPSIEVAELAIRQRFLRSSAWCQGIVALCDSLRPELSISRDTLISLPWAIYSAGGLALYLALRESGIDLRSQHWELFSGDPGRGNSLALGRLLEDVHLTADNGWPSLPIIETEEGILSLKEIREEVQNRSVKVISLPFQRPGSGGFLAWCSAALVQTGLDAAVEWEGDGYCKPNVIASGHCCGITEGHKLFPPLTFLPFIDSDHLGSQRSVLNLKHPFSTWLLEKAPAIATRYPGLFKQLRSTLLDRWFVSSPEAIKALNKILDRLRNLHTSVHPPRTLALKSEDFRE